MSEPARRIRALVEMATPRDLPDTLSTDKYLQILNEILQLAHAYAREGNDEKAFVLFLRFVSITVEELPNHPAFNSLAPADLNAIDAKTIEAMTTAEALKNAIRTRYESETAANGVVALPAECSTSAAASLSAPGLDGSGGSQITLNPGSLLEWDIGSEAQLSPYALCHRLSVQPIVFQRIIIPNNLPPTFMAAASVAANDRFAFLYGKLVRNSLIASHMLFAAADDLTGGAPTFKRYIHDEENESLPLVGYIGSKFVEVARFHDTCRLSEMLCIICPPGPNRSLVLHLVSVPPSLANRHPGESANGLASYSGCGHLHITNSISSAVYKESA